LQAIAIDAAACREPGHCNGERLEHELNKTSHHAPGTHVQQALAKMTGLRK
jgi:hypothetical protein